MLLADIGGTNARFAIADEKGIGALRAFEVGDHDDPLAAIRAYLAATHAARPPRGAVLAVAGPVSGGRAALTNGTWRFDAAALSASLSLEPVLLINDLAAVAWAITELADQDLLPIGDGTPVPTAPVAVIGPGTGLGVAGYLPAREGAAARVLMTEGGHVTMAATSEREAHLLERLRAHLGHVSAERLLSGEGLENLYAAIAALDRLHAPERTAPEIVAYAESGECPASRAALETFMAMLGTFAGNVALTLGARGGVYLAGGILPRVAERLAASSFRARFDDKGRFRDYLAAIPVWLIMRRDPALLGLWSLVRRG